MSAQHRAVRKLLVVSAPAYGAARAALLAPLLWYKSGINDTSKADLKTIADTAAAAVNLKPDDICLDIGANDGTTLSYLKGRVTRVGCEPTTNLLPELKTNAEYVIGDFWTKENYGKLNLGKAKAITAIGMFYDMEDPNQFIRDAVHVLAPEGVFIAQLMTLKPMLMQNDLGNICHEPPRVLHL